MNRYHITDQARLDVAEIWLWIARSSAEAADRVADRLLEAIQKVADAPTLRHRRDDVTDHSLRFYTVYSYQVVYREGTDPLEIVRVLSGYRDIPNLLN